ncbi:MAG TPA: uroporphyrinogen-III C-methyltransferase [Vicinamibacterales bacterium]|nr:uroporphyrinogen-III C-methyltransferase [Vicinamibacterales bacterium]
MAESIVYLIGAGPGNPELITVRGLQCLAEADVVLYDHLVHPRLLRSAKPTAEKIDVGMPAPLPLEQEAICYLLAEKAVEGKIVARLKWGDPFIFDSGGSEALFLHERRIRFEVIPGIPAAMGAAAYSGVPLTYRGGGDTLTFVRGNEGAANALPDVDWTSLATLDGTIVCYAGPDQLPQMLDALLKGGRPEDDTAALIYDGTLPTQQTTLGTLAEIAHLVNGSAERRPAILVVGRVAALREHLRWFDARPLFGKRILVTRPREQAAEFVSLLQALGADPIEAPMIRIVPPTDYAPLDEACNGIDRFDWAVFTSGNAVEAFMGRLLASAADVRALKSVRICAIGAGTAERFTRYGIKVDLIPPESRAESVIQALLEEGAVQGQRVLLPRADIGREVIGEELRKRGAAVEEVIAYRTIAIDPERDGEPDVYRMLLDRRIDVVTFTSPSSVRSFAELYGADAAADLLHSTDVAAIGPVTAEAAAQLGITCTIVPAQYTIQAMCAAIVTHFEAIGTPTPEAT